jgi:hypothetical protein
MWIRRGIVTHAQVGDCSTPPARRGRTSAGYAIAAGDASEPVRQDAFLLEPAPLPLSGFDGDLDPLCGASAVSMLSQDSRKAFLQARGLSPANSSTADDLVRPRHTTGHAQKRLELHAHAPYLIVPRFYLGNCAGEIVNGESRPTCSASDASGFALRKRLNHAHDFIGG